MRRDCYQRPLSIWADHQRTPPAVATDTALSLDPLATSPLRRRAFAQPIHHPWVARPADHSMRRIAINEQRSTSSLPVPDGTNDASARSATIWFWLERPVLKPERRTGPRDGEMSGSELARRLGRNRRTVRQAIQRGRIVCVRRDATDVYVRVSDDEIAAWLAHPFEHVLARARLTDPSLSRDLRGWRTLAELVRIAGLSHRDVTNRLLRAGVPVVEWGGETPFRAERKFFLPCLPGPLAPR